MKWYFETRSLIETSPAIGTDGTIYFGSYDNTFRALNPDGTIRWSLTLENWFPSSPATRADGTVYVGSYFKYGVTDYYFYTIGTPVEQPSEQSTTQPTDGTLMIAIAAEVVIVLAGLALWLNRG